MTTEKVSSPSAPPVPGAIVTLIWLWVTPAGMVSVRGLAGEPSSR